MVPRKGARKRANREQGEARHRESLTVPATVSEKSLTIVPLMRLHREGGERPRSASQETCLSSVAILPYGVFDRAVLR